MAITAKPVAPYAPRGFAQSRISNFWCYTDYKTSEHFFLIFLPVRTFSKQWTRAGHLQEEVANKMAGGWITACSRGIFHAMRPILALKYPMQSGKFLICVAGRTCWLHG